MLVGSNFYLNREMCFLVTLTHEKALLFRGETEVEGKMEEEKLIMRELSLIQQMLTSAPTHRKRRDCIINPYKYDRSYYSH